MIIFMGVAGSGKSVQGRMLADNLALPWLSTGEFLRMLVSGQKRKDMTAGKLLSDQEMIGLVQRIFGLINPKEEFVLDGFPRSAHQADWLINQVKHYQVGPAVVIHLVATEEVVNKRLQARGRPDDIPEAIDERFREFEQSAKPILEHFAQAGIKVYEVDAEQPVEQVHRNILNCLKKG